MDQTTPEKRTTNSAGTLYVGMELSAKRWKLAMSDGGTRTRLAAVDAGAVADLLQATAKAKEKFGLTPDARVVSCYEAGRDGFWIHRAVVATGIQNIVVDPASIEVDRRQRRAKTDKLDALKLLYQLIRHRERGDRLRTVRVPTPVEEDARRPIRELERLKKERTAHLTRIKALLALHGIRATVKAAFHRLITSLRDANGEALPSELAAELQREAERLHLVRAQIRTLEKARVARIDARGSKAADVAARLMLLRGIGANAASIYAWEFFGWREFKNRRQVGASAGLTGTPFASGDVTREQGISKAGNRRVRAIAIELGWAWLWYQPQSALARWYFQRFGDRGGRARRVGIVALARRLLVALWRYVDQGIVPEGAIMKA